MEEKQLTSRELEEQANALLAEADFEEINLPKKAKKAAAAKKANEDTAQAEKRAGKRLHRPGRRQPDFHLQRRRHAGSLGIPQPFLSR